MAINYPTSTDTLTNPLLTDTQDSPSHSGQHSDANDILEALEAKVGVNSSAVTSSLDYKVENTLLPLAGGTMTGDILGAVSLASTGTRMTKAWLENLEVTNDITIGGTALASIYSPLAGSSSITTVGTIGTGNWEGTAINQTYLVGQSGTNTGDEIVASGAELDTGTDDVKYASAKAIKDSHNVPSVAPSTDGKVMTSNGTDWISETPATVPVKASASDLNTGTDDAKFATAKAINDSQGNIRWLVFNLVEAGTDCAVASNIAGDFVSPIAGTILQSDSTPFYLYATNSTAGTTGTMVVDVSIGGTSIMTTNKIDIDTTEKTSTTGATQPDLTTTALAVGDIITIDIDAIHTTAAKGLTLYMAIRE